MGLGEEYGRRLRLGIRAKSEVILEFIDWLIDFGFREQQKKNMYQRFI